MSEYVTTGALLKCIGGTLFGKLQVTSNKKTYIQDKLMATTSDKVSMLNIMPFGNCLAQPFSPPCLPKLAMWEGFQTSVQISGSNPLLSTSTIRCTCGGIISFVNSWQLKPAKVTIGAQGIKLKIKAIDVYWMEEEESDEKRRDIFPNFPVTLYIKTFFYKEGEFIKLDFKDSEGRIFKGNKKSLSVSGNVDASGILRIDDFKVEYEEEKIC